ncbi:MAG: ATP-binding protein [Candidatus Omnitrophota bacterium]
MMSGLSKLFKGLRSLAVNLKPKKSFFQEKLLLLSFFILIFSTFLIGSVGISKIYWFNAKVKDLAQHNLKLESAVLEMRIRNANFAMGVRNYVFWRASRYLQSVSIAGDLDKIFISVEDFKEHLKAYRQSSYLKEQRDWADEVALAFDGVVQQGKRLVELLEKEEPGRISELINSQLMSFENNVYRIDEFLDKAMGKSNLAEVERQMLITAQDKEQAISFLKVSLILSIFMGLVIASIVYRRIVREKAYRQKLFDRIVNLEENERKKLSFAVHNEMGQDLSALKIYLGLISQELPDIAEDIKKKLDECKKIAIGLIEKSHNISFLLRPPELDEVGLLESIESLLLEAKHLTGIEYSFQKPKLPLNCSAERSLLLYRASQELLTNMIKYAKAKNVVLRLNRIGDSAQLFYYDDGCGFDLVGLKHKLLRRREDKFGLGLLSLKERVELLGGDIKINSSLGKGTTIMVNLPL